MELKIPKSWQAFINEYANLIDSNDWEEIIELMEQWANKTGEAVDEWDFWEIIRQAGIDPLEHLDFIPRCYYYESDETYISIPKHITRIGYAAFAHSALTEIEIPKNVKEIEGSAFRQCGNLKQIILPPQLERVGNAAFLQCTALERVEISSSTEVEYAAFWQSDNFVLVVDGKEATKKEYGLV